MSGQGNGPQEDELSAGRAWKAAARRGLSAASQGLRQRAASLETGDRRGRVPGNCGLWRPSVFVVSTIKEWEWLGAHPQPDCDERSEKVAAPSCTVAVYSSSAAGRPPAGQHRVGRVGPLSCENERVSCTGNKFARESSCCCTPKPTTSSAANECTRT